MKYSWVVSSSRHCLKVGSVDKKPYAVKQKHSIICIGKKAAKDILSDSDPFLHDPDSSGTHRICVHNLEPSAEKLNKCWDIRGGATGFPPPLFSHCIVSHCIVYVKILC